MILQDNIYIFTGQIYDIRLRSASREYVFHFRQTNFASYEESTASPVCWQYSYSSQVGVDNRGGDGAWIKKNWAFNWWTPVMRRYVQKQNVIITRNKLQSTRIWFADVGLIRFTMRTVISRKTNILVCRNCHRNNLHNGGTISTSTFGDTATSATNITIAKWTFIMGCRTPNGQQWEQNIRLGYATIWPRYQVKSSQVAFNSMWHSHTVTGIKVT